MSFSIEFQIPFPSPYFYVLLPVDGCLMDEFVEVCDEGGVETEGAAAGFGVDTKKIVRKELDGLKVLGGGELQKNQWVVDDNTGYKYCLRSDYAVYTGDCSISYKLYHFGETGVDVLNPKTGEVMYSFEVYGIPTMDEAVKAGWDEWRKNEKMAPKYREEYPPGTRIMLLHMDDPYAPVPPNTRGTVDHIDSQSQFMMHWDNGRTLALVPGKDSFRKLTEEELAEEQNEDITESEDAPEMSM